MNVRKHAEDALAAVFEADSPDKHALALDHLLSDLADAARDSAAEVTANWQDRSSGEPWRKQARRLERAARCFREIQMAAQ